MQAAGGKALGRTVTIIALPALLGPILGPLVGGAILTHFSWRFMFWVNVPFCVVGLFLAARYMPGRHPGPGQAQAAPGPARPGPARPRHRRGHPRPEQRGQRRRLRPPGRHRPAGHRRRAPRRVHLLRPAAHRSARGRAPARPPPGRLGLRGAVLLRLLPLRRHAAAAAVLPGGTRRLPAGRRNHARPAGRRRPALPRPGRTADRQDRGPPDRRRRLRRRRRLDHPLRLRRDEHQQVAARVLAGRPRLRARRGHDPGDGGRLPRAWTSSRSPSPAC